MFTPRGCAPDSVTEALIYGLEMLGLVLICRDPLLRSSVRLRGGVRPPRGLLSPCSYPDSLPLTTNFESCAWLTFTPTTCRHCLKLFSGSISSLPCPPSNAGTDLECSSFMLFAIYVVQSPFLMCITTISLNRWKQPGLANAALISASLIVLRSREPAFYS